MATADSNDTTIASDNASMSRRLALTALAGGALVGTTIRYAAAAPVDPVFAAIDAHKAALTDLGRILDENSEKKDDLAAEQLITAGHQRDDDAFYALVDVQPTTMAGVFAILDYASHLTQGRFERGYETLVDYDGREAPWFNFLFGNVQRSLMSLSA